MQALSERLDALLAGLTLRRADLLGFSSLKTYDPSPDSLRPPAPLGRSPGQVPPLGVRGRVPHGAPSLPGGAGRRRGPPEEDRSHAARWPASCSDRGTRASTDLALPCWCASTARSARRRGGSSHPATKDPLAGLGPEPGSEEFAAFIRTSDSTRHLTTDLRDQHVVPGIGRGWGDDILHRAKLSPFVSLRSLSDDQREPLLAATDDVLAEALELERERRAASRRRGSVAGSRCTAAPASRARRPAATRSGGCPSSPTRWPTARPARPAARCWPTAACRAC